MDDLIKYLICFLTGCGEESEIISSVGYTSNEDIFVSYKLVIIPSGFFNDDFYGQKKSMPILPLQFISNIPLPYGKPVVEKKDSTLIVHADLLASAYFFISRYEEWIQPDLTDEHGRFLGKNSIAFKENFIHRPVVDEYGKLLRQYLREAGLTIEEPQEKFKKIYLTHDVDCPFLYRTFRTLGGALIRSIKQQKNEVGKALKFFGGDVESDPMFTFPWILKKNNELGKTVSVPVESVFFVKSGKYSCFYDKPYYNLRSKDVQHLFHIIKKSGSTTIGLHSSYTSADDPELIRKEKAELEKHSGEMVVFNRNHYLRSKKPSDMNYLIEAGITDDFTMGYADVSGFRLGTCRPVKWINVATKQVTELTLHPLTMMDVVLDEEKYMNLNFDEAFQYAVSLIDETKKLNGELVLLWHNNTLTGTYKFDHKKLYLQLLNYLKNTDKWA